MNEDKLIKFVNLGYSTYRIASETNTCQCVIYKKLKKFGLKTKLMSEYQKEKFCKTCNKKLTGKQLSFCSRGCNNKNKERAVRVYKREKIRAANRRIDLIRLKGGKCEKCGYDKNYSALSFHHINPSDKKFTIGNNCAQYSWKKLMIESNKCSLLCSNCHMELHHPTFKKSETTTLNTDL